jgi:hypothetical protein
MLLAELDGLKAKSNALARLETKINEIEAELDDVQL